MTSLLAWTSRPRSKAIRSQRRARRPIDPFHAVPAQVELLENRRLLTLFDFTPLSTLASDLDAPQLADVEQQLRQTLEQVGQQVREIVQQRLDPIGDVLGDSTVAQIEQQLDSVEQAVSQKLQSVFSGVEQQLQSAGDQIGTALNQVTDEIEMASQLAQNQIGSQPGGAVQQVQTAAAGVGGTADSTGDGPISSQLGSAIGGALDDLTGQLSNILGELGLSGDDILPQSLIGNLAAVAGNRSADAAGDLQELAEALAQEKAEATAELTAGTSKPVDIEQTLDGLLKDVHQPIDVIDRELENAAGLDLKTMAMMLPTSLHHVGPAARLPGLLGGTI